MRVRSGAKVAAVAACLALALSGCDGLYLVGPTAGATSDPAQTSDPETALGRFETALLAAQRDGAAMERDRYVQALIDAGFARESVEATGTTDTLGDPVISFEISTKGDEGCLIGQITETRVVTSEGPVLGSGTCLIGSTPALD